MRPVLRGKCRVTAVYFLKSSLLQSGSDDIGFGPAGVVVDDTVEVVPLWSDPLWVALRPDDPLCAGEAVSWRDLRDKPLISYMPNLAANVLSQVPARHHPRKVVAVHRVNTAMSMLRVREGGVVSPSLSQPLVQGFGLRFLPLKQPTVGWKIALFARRRPSLSPAVQSFLQFARGFTPARQESMAPPQH